ncbi:MAG: nucleoside-diphosphate kinase [Verrucomicrobiota bacterium]|jgi:nucleoside diphosphate kinase|nr:nucleoside-diphosphate kinase [Verrucomicrobiota bacterium]
MAQELAFVLINPYTVSKSRTGGVIGRYISRTGLDLVAARMFAPSAELAKKYAELIRKDPAVDPASSALLAEYVEQQFAPDPTTGATRRVMMLLFEGEDAIQKVKKATGPIRPDNSGETIRDTYGDYILNTSGMVQYLEPAVFIGPSVESTAEALRLWSGYSPECGGIVDAAGDVTQDATAEKVLVILKPDNFRFASARPGHIIDIFSRSGLRIVGAKIHRMSVKEAEEFYGPVQYVLREKLKGMVAERAAKAIASELDMKVPDAVKGQLSELLGPMYGDNQFYKIVQFMTGRWGEGLVEEEKAKPGTERSLLLVYTGSNAVSRIRDILGPTDPSKALPGSVRREFGQDIMVNAAHASDSVENARREMGITKVGDDTIRQWVDVYYP